MFVTDLTVDGHLRNKMTFFSQTIVLIIPFSVFEVHKNSLFDLVQSKKLIKKLTS